MAACLHSPEPGVWLLRVKVVPGSRRDALAGPLGDRLKVRVAAPPEQGRANDAVCRLIARSLQIPGVRVALDAGATSPEKTLRLVGLPVELAAPDLERRLGLSAPQPPGAGAGAG